MASRLILHNVPRGNVVEVWHAANERRTLAVVSGVVCLEYARTVGNFTITQGIYHGEVPGMLACLGLLAAPLIGYGPPNGFRFAAMLLFLSAASSLGPVAVDHDLLAIAIATLAGLLVMKPEFFKTSEAELRRPPSEVGFPTVFAMLIVGLTFLISGLALAFDGGIVLRGDAASSAGLVLAGLAVMILGRNRFAFVAGGLVGVGLMGYLASTSPGFLNFFNRGARTSGWLGDGLAIATILLLGLWAALHLILEGRRLILWERTRRAGYR